MLKNLKFANGGGGITAEYADPKDGKRRYIDKNDGDLYADCVAGIFGHIEPYSPPPQPTKADVAAIRTNAIAATAESALKTGRAIDVLQSKLIMEIIRSLLTGDKSFWVDPVAGGNISNQTAFKRKIEVLLDGIIDKHV